MNTKITLEVDHYEYLTIKKILSLPKMELENFMKTQMTSDINVTHKPTRFPGREVPSWMHEELSKKDATAPTLSPESERELNNILDHIDGVETHGLPDENGLYFEGKLKSLLAKAEQRARDEGYNEALKAENLMPSIKKDIREAYQAGVTTTLERIEGIIGDDEDAIIWHETNGAIGTDADAVGKNLLRAEQRKALSTLKQELLKGNDAE
jgi:hypothetical protein